METANGQGPFVQSISFRGQLIKCLGHYHFITEYTENIKEWTGMDFASSTRTAENRTRWKGIVANSSVEPWRPSKVMG